MRILFLSTYFRPESATNAILMTLLAEELVRLGHEVSVITGMPHYDANRIEDAYRGKLWVRERHGDIPVTRVYLYVPGSKTSISGRLLNYLSFNVLSTVAGLAAKKHDILFVPSPPLTNGVCAFLLSRLRRMPFVYNVQDIYPDVAVRLGVLRNPRLIRLFERMEAFVYRKAATVSVISESFRRNLRAKNVPESKLAVIPNFVDIGFVTPLPRSNPFSREHGWDGKFVALFAGNVGLSQGLESVLEAAALLADLPDVLVAVVGGGSTKQALVDRAAQMGLSNLQFLPLQPYERVPELYSAADVGLVPLRRGLTEDSVPSKLWTIMGVARPVVAGVDETSDTFAVIQAADSGLCVPPEDPAALAGAIRALYADRAGAEAMGRRGRRHVEAHYTRDGVARQYAALFARLTGTDAEHASFEVPRKTSCPPAVCWGVAGALGLGVAALWLRNKSAPDKR